MATLLALGINILRLFQVLLKWKTMLFKITHIKKTPTRFIPLPEPFICSVKRYRSNAQLQRKKCFTSTLLHILSPSQGHTKVARPVYKYALFLRMK
jgi:hypothetical protein